MAAAFADGESKTLDGIIDRAAHLLPPPSFATLPFSLLTLAKIWDYPLNPADGKPQNLGWHHGQSWPSFALLDTLCIVTLMFTFDLTARL